MVILDVESTVRCLTMRISFFFLNNNNNRKTRKYVTYKNAYFKEEIPSSAEKMTKFTLQLSSSRKHLTKPCTQLYKWNLLN
jgi:hypothetical protein